ncbi:hypothetical protein EON65_48620, partial [archaeon]
GTATEMIDEWAAASPGLLDRPPSERNSMEQLTFASLSALPTAVIYVVDLSGKGVRSEEEGGPSAYEASILKQLKVRGQVRAQFPHRPWIDVLSKADDLGTGVVNERDEIPPTLSHFLPPNAIRVSVKTGEGLDRMRGEVREMLEGLERRLREGKLRD